MFSEDGILNLDLSFGEYYFEMDVQDVANGSEYDTIFVTTPSPIAIGVSGIEEPIDLALQALWKINANVSDQSFAPSENITVEFDYTDSSNFLTDLKISTDENGTITQYVPAGNYTVTIGPYDVNGTTQLFRSLVTIDENIENRTFDWRTLEGANLNLTLVESDEGGFYNESLNKGLSFTAVSNDGLGEVILPPSNFTGVVSAMLYPGDWTLELNHTDSSYGIRWIVEEYHLGELSENQTVDAEIDLSRFVEVSGHAYWDFNEDGEFQSSEALDESEVKINSDGFESLNMTTEFNGKWSFFVPAYSNYSVEISRSGFTDNNSLTIELDNESISEGLDVSLDADEVLVSGKIEIQYGFSQNLIDAIISEMFVELIPAADEGYDRENVQISFEINEDGEIVWNASVEPGKWVFHAESSNYLMVVYDAFEAEIIDGGEHNTTIKAGGYLPISTRWTDFSGDERDILTLESANSTISDTVPLTLTLIDAKWNITVSQDAEIWLLPAGSLQISGEFKTMEMEMEMEYEGDTITGAYPPGIDEFGQLAPVTSAEAVVEFNRILVHEVEFSVSQIISDGEIIDYVEGEMVNVTAYDNDGDGISDEYKEITVTLDLNYAGNVATENYTLTASVSGTDKNDWSVKFENGTNNFEEVKNMSFGISESPSNGVLVIKIKMPSTENSISYDTGHNIRIIATSDVGELSSFDFKVHIPQDYSIDASAPEMLGMTYGGGTSSFDVSINNLGNGDDLMSFEIDSSELPDGWEVSQPMPRTIPANGTSEVGIIVTMPQDTFAGEYTISVNITSESGIVDVVEVLVLVSKADLRMDTPSLGGEALIRQPVDFSIIVHNDGLVAADGVVIIGYIEELNITASSLPITILSESNETVTVLFDTVEIEAGEYKFTFTIEVPDVDLLKENPTPVDLTQKFHVSSDVGSTNIVPIIIVLIFAIGIYSFIRSRRSGSGPGF